MKMRNRPTQTMNLPTAIPIRTECPPGTCVCGRDALLANPAADWRVMCLTRAEEKRLLERLENLTSLADLRRMEGRMFDQLGIRLSITPSPNEVRTLRGIVILVHEQPGLCRKTRQSIPAAIKHSMERHPEIAWALLDEDGLFGGM
jgi:hypothetical protein